MDFDSYYINLDCGFFIDVLAVYMINQWNVHNKDGKDRLLLVWAQVIFFKQGEVRKDTAGVAC